MKTLARTLSDLRKIKKLTQAELAQKAGISLATWHNFEAGHGNPELKTLQSVLEVLGLTLDLRQKSIDWNLLSNLGVPILDSEQKERIRPDKGLLIDALNRISPSLEAILKGSREEKAVVSFLTALKEHFPRTYGELNLELEKWTSARSIGASVKLRRIALQKLAEYL